LNGLLQNNREQIAGIIEDFGAFSSDLAERGPRLMQDVSDATDALRGLMESTGGAGIEYHPFGDNLWFGVEGWDFGEPKPHLKLFAQTIIKRHFIINLGWDDFGNSDTRSFFAGAGFTFEDNDLKYLLSKLPLPGF